MQKLEEKKAVMTETTDCNDLGFSDWENFTDDIDFASLEQSLEMTEANTETLNDKIINFLSDGEYYSQKRGGIELDSSTYSKEETSLNDSFETQLRKFTSSLDINPLPVNPSNLSTGGKSPFTVYLKRDPITETYYNFPRKIDPYVSNATIRNSFLPFEKYPALDDEKSFTSRDNLQLKCIARDQRLITQNYVNRNDKAVFIEKTFKCRMQDEENQKYTRTLPYISRLEVLNIQENGVSCPDQIVSSTIMGNQNNIPNKESATCKSITSSKEHYDSERIIFLSDENFDSQKMIISSQESSDGQRMIISSQETSDSQRMITSSQESSGPESMIISSQEYLGSQKMITSSQDISDSQKMIVSSQDSLDDQRIIFNQESFCGQKIISGQESFDSKNLLSYEVPKEIPSYQETSVRHKLFNTRSRSFLKISKKINLKTENKSYRSLGSRLSLKDQKLHKFLDYKRFAGVMTTQYNGKKVSPLARKIEIGMNEQKKFISSRR